jgi:hypothetical protein
MTFNPHLSDLSSNRLWYRAGPVGVILAAFLIGLLWLSIARIALIAMHWDRLTEVHDWWKMLFIDSSVSAARDSDCYLFVVSWPSLARTNCRRLVCSRCRDHRAHGIIDTELHCRVRQQTRPNLLRVSALSEGSLYDVI